MHAIRKYVGSSIGRKQLMGLAGIHLYIFLLIHLVGNIGLLAGPERFNQYGYLLLHTLAEVIVPAEISLVVALLLHVVLAFKLQAENRAARPVAYEAKGSGGRKTLYSSTMMFTGLLILFFVLVHIPHFRFGILESGPFTGPRMVSYDGVEMRDLYTTVMEAFAVWWYTLFYVATFVFIFSHLAHGVQSSLQSLGFNHPKYRAFVLFAGRAYAVAISGGFSALAIWAFIQGGAV